MPDTDDFSSLFEFLPIGAYRSLPDGTQLRANPALVRLNGYADEAEMLAAVRDIAFEWYVDPQRRALFRRLLEATARSRASNRRSAATGPASASGSAKTPTSCATRRARVLFYEGTVEEITERVQTRARRSAAASRSCSRSSSWCRVSSTAP